MNGSLVITGLLVLFVDQFTVESDGSCRKLLTSDSLWQCFLFRSVFKLVVGELCALYDSHMS